MLSRRDRIVVLAWSLTDALRVLAGSSRETRRLSPAVWQLCGACDGGGVVRDRWGRPSACGVCGGAGRYRTDPYADGAPVSGAGSGPATRVLSRRVPCDRCGGHGVVPARWLARSMPCAATGSILRGAGGSSLSDHRLEGRGAAEAVTTLRSFNIESNGSGLAACPTCDGTGTISAPIHDSDSRTPGAADHQIAWRWQGGDWHDLDRTLDRLRATHRQLWRAFVAAYVEPPWAHTADADRALDLVDAWMPGRARVPADIERAWRERQQRDLERRRRRSQRMGGGWRDRAIRAQLRLGRTPLEVARMYGVSERTVRRVA